MSQSLRPTESAFPCEKRLVVIDSDERCVRPLARRFSPSGWTVVPVRDSASADLHCPADAFVIDVSERGVAKVDVIQRVRLAAPGSRIIAVTSYPSLPLAVAVTRAGADACLTRPVEPDDLERIIADPSSIGLQTEFSRLPSLARIQWDYIARVLSSVDGNISLAARTLGIQRSTLQRKLKKYPPHW